MQYYKQTPRTWRQNQDQKELKQKQNSQAMLGMIIIYLISCAIYALAYSNQ